MTKQLPLLRREAFIEQAEYLDKRLFLDWGAEHPDERRILKKLEQSGAKLITGPRGCGKTTLMLKAYFGMLGDAKSALPVYVNFKRSLALEPLYASGKRGSYFFSQWVLAKVYAGLLETLSTLKNQITLSVDNAELSSRISALEAGNFEAFTTNDLTADQLEIELVRAAEKCGRGRVVLLLDDAAHAFSPSQQRDFFDFFRQIKSREVSPKAAIYPGVTSYSSSFHVGHDAEEIDVWVKPDRAGYLKFMRGVVEKRFPPHIVASIYRDSTVADFLCYAAFGVPRAFLNVLQALLDDVDQEEGSVGRSLKRREVIAKVKDHVSQTRKLFRSLKSKVPAFANFVNNGEAVFDSAIRHIKEYNRGKPTEKQSVVIAINAEDMGPELSRLFGLFQYAGMCIARSSVSRGEKGRFELFTVHYGALIAANALLGAKAVNLEEYVCAFGARDAHEFTRASPKALAGGSSLHELFALSLPSCSVCGTPRVNKDANFCVNCGARLTAASTYYAAINQDISALPLTDARVGKIKQQSSIRKIKDILLDEEHKELRRVDRIGPFWAERIVRLAEEFVE